MIVLKTGRELKIMKEACSISAGALEAAGKAVEPGVTTAEIDRLAEEYIRRRGGEPNFKNYEGYAATFACGDVSPEAKRLMDTTRESLYEGIHAACAGGRIGDIGHAVQSYVEARGYSVVREFVGHGVGTHLHEAPEVPNFGTPGRGIRLMPGMTIAIEPMVNAGGYDVKVQPDGWTVLTKDGSLSAHFENTIVITADGPKIMTVV